MGFSKFSVFFFILFQERYLSRNAGELLLEFLNILLVAFGSQFIFPTSMVTLQKFSCINEVFNGANYFVVCSIVIGFAARKCPEASTVIMSSIQTIPIHQELFHVTTPSLRRPVKITGLPRKYTHTCPSHKPWNAWYLTRIS